MEELCLIPTKCSALQKVEANDLLVVVHKSKQKHVERKPVLTDQLKVEKREMDMKKVRYDVFKFGMSGFKAERKEEVKVALAIRLGAVPPKNKCYNYKEYKLMKEKQLKELSEQRKLFAVRKTKAGKPSTKGKKKFVSGQGKKNKDGILDPYGKPGKAQTSVKVRKR
ncbi:uncharacterized protein C1orf131 homolog [Zootermopsis nevadensis]|uniref:uncharacterized protein C1orf131 homolog n=1 Tax=Zootermopsis nevadensis TaxID=136037 RepID=UPI000B8EB3D7|nr:uncharacterized protein C1orf131 homolog [Zootermopsis nevadensis]